MKEGVLRRKVIDAKSGKEEGSWYTRALLRSHVKGMWKKICMG